MFVISLSTIKKPNLLGTKIVASLGYDRDDDDDIKPMFFCQLNTGSTATLIGKH